jgi:hypothetical protein
VVEHSLGKGEVGSSILPMGTNNVVFAPLAHLVEHLTCNHEVVCSNQTGGTRMTRRVTRCLRGPFSLSGRVLAALHRSVRPLMRY